MFAQDLFVLSFVRTLLIIVCKVFTFFGFFRRKRKQKAKRKSLPMAAALFHEQERNYNTEGSALRRFVKIENF